MRKSFMAVLLATVALPGVACAQSQPTAYTNATRFDAMHRVTGTIAPDPDGSGPLHYAAVRSTYDAAGRLIKVETGELSAWQDESIAPTSWSGFTVLRQVDTSYDGMDRKIAERVSKDGVVYAVTQYSYDVVGRPECTVVRMNPNANPSAALPGAVCTRTASQEAADTPDRITKNVYDAVGQLRQVQKAVDTPLAQTYVSYDYTPNGKQASVTDANGNLATMSYDGHDRQKTWVFPSKTQAGQTNPNDYEAYDYDANGNRTYWRKRDGHEFTFCYDALNRQTAKLTVATACGASSYAVQPTRNVFYQYDAWGRQTAARFDAADGSDRVESGYDGFGRLTATTTAMAGTSRSLAFHFDADGNRDLVTHPDNSAWAYAYDGLDRLNGITQGGTSVVTLSYDQEGRRQNAMRGAVSSSYGYDASGRLHTLGDDLAGTARDVTTTLGYNPAAQITSETRDNDGYAFTGLANRNQSYSVNGLNQYIAVGGAMPTYDDNGNLTSDETKTYGYDAENRMVSASTGAALTYDPLGRLWQAAGNGSTVQFLYDGDQLTAEYDGNGNLLRRYVHGTSEDDPQLWYEGAGLGDRRSLQSDHEGSIVSVADGGGNALAVNSYDEYGKPAAGNQGRFQYTGQAWMPNVGLYYYKARMYDPATGRFMQTDSVGYKDQINLYAYVANDPVDGTDPSGECTGSLFSGSEGGCTTSAGVGPSETSLEAAMHPTANAANDHTYRDALGAGGAAAGAVLGGILGAGGGAAGGGALCAAGGPLAAGCAAEGASIGAPAGATAGGIVGGAGGALVGGIIDGGIALFNKATGSGDGFKSPTSGSGKEKASDAPSWAKGDSAARPRMGETPTQSATRVLDSKYGSGNYPKGPGSEFNKVQKWHARGFQ